MAFKVAILCLFLVSTLLSPQVHGKKVDTEETAAVRTERQACGKASPLSITIGLPPLIAKLLGGKSAAAKSPFSITIGLPPILSKIFGGGKGLSVKSGIFTKPKVIKIGGGGKKKLLLAPLLLLLPLLGPLALLPIIILSGPFSPIAKFQGRGYLTRALIFSLIFRKRHGFSKPGYFDGLSAGNRIPLMNQWGQKLGIFPILGFPLSWRLHNQWGSPTSILNQI